MDRSRSPLSENSIRRVIDEEYLDDSFVSNVVCSEDSDSSESCLFGDNTDDDPDFIPNYNSDSDQPGPSNQNVQPRPSNQNVGLQPRQDVLSSDSSDEDGSTQPSPIPTTRPRGRPRTVIPDDDSSDDESGWIEVSEENDPGYPDNFSCNDNPSVKHCPNRNSPPVSYFYLFFTPVLLDMFVKYTNLYADNYLRRNNGILPPNSRSRVWRPVTRLEIIAFLAVLINMGLNPKATIYSFWSTSSSQFIPWFGRMFNRNRFQGILTFFHMVDTSNLPRPGQPGYDPCARFQPLVEHANRISKLYFSPGQYLSIDESMISTKKPSQLLQYLPKKRHRFGVKLWSICDSLTHYCLSFFVYKGATNNEDKAEIKKMGLGPYVVVKLLQMTNLLNKGYHIFVDNFFTTISLAKYLYSKLTFLTGTLRHNRKDIPRSMTSKFKVGEKST